jgi:hypothetical protein
MQTMVEKVKLFRIGWLGGRLMVTGARAYCGLFFFHEMKMALKKTNGELRCSNSPS